MDRVILPAKLNMVEAGGIAVKKSWYKEVQIYYALSQAEHETPVKGVIRKLGISEHTFYSCKKKYGVTGTTELHRLKLLDE